MVYDDRGHFIGETHWTAEGDLANGDELHLDRGSAIVQVAECVGSQQQDLTSLLEKRAMEVNQRRAAMAGRNEALAPRTARGDQQLSATYSPHPLRPLTSVLNSPVHTGRAVIPTKSPFESKLLSRSPEYMTVHPRHQRKKRSASPPSRLGHARSLFGTKLTLSSTPQNLQEARTQRVPHGDEKAFGTGMSYPIPSDDTRSSSTRVLQTPQTQSPKRTLAVPKDIEFGEGTKIMEDAMSTIVSDRANCHARITAGSAQPLAVALSPVPDALHTCEEQQNQPRCLDHGSCECPVTGPGSVCSKVTKIPDQVSTPCTKRTSTHSDNVEDDSMQRDCPMRLKQTDAARSPETLVSHKKAQTPALRAKHTRLALARPRTVLRISSRRRKGLLHLTENVSSRVFGKDPNATRSEKTDSPVRNASLENHGILQEPGKSSSTARETRAWPVADKHLERVSDIHNPPPGLRNETYVVTNINRDSFPHKARNGTDHELREPVHFPDSLTTTVLEDPNLKQSNNGPRIARMSRKSIKSKEIIGFVPNTTNLLVGSSPDSSKDQESKATPRVEALSMKVHCDKDKKLPVEMRASTPTYEPGSAKGKLRGGAGTDATTPTSATQRDEAAELLNARDSRLIPSETSRSSIPDGDPSDAFESKRRCVRAQWMDSTDPERATTNYSRRDQHAHVGRRHALSNTLSPGANIACEQQCAGSDTRSEAHRLFSRQAHTHEPLLSRADLTLSCSGPQEIDKLSETDQPEPEFASEGDGAIVRRSISLLPATSGSSGSSIAKNCASKGMKVATGGNAAGGTPPNLVEINSTKATICMSSIRRSRSASAEDLSFLCKANGGPWSKHAVDLLGITRPAGSA